MLDLLKPLKTKQGYIVSNIRVNKSPNVAFPISGTVHLSEKNKKSRTWTLDGKYSIDGYSPWDLVNSN
jgi:hypothetical protein